MTEDDGGSVASPSTTIALRLERLFDASWPPDAPQRQWRNREVVAACRASGRDLSESHLSELRRGIKNNPTSKTLESIGWFFGVRPGYLVDDEVDPAIERELAERARQRDAALAEAAEAARLERDAALDLQRAMRESGVTRAAHRGAHGDRRKRAKMMQALAKALRDDDDEQGFA